MTTHCTHKAREIIENAKSIALRYQQQFLYPEHLLSAFLSSKSYRHFLTASHLDISKCELALNNKILTFPKQNQENLKQIEPSGQFQSCLQQALDMASKFGDTFLSAEILLLALYKDPNLMPFIMKHGGSAEALEGFIITHRNGNKATSENSENTYDCLSQYTQDLTQRAREGKLDPVIGRDENIKQMICVLCRRTKNNPILIGSPGIGKTAIIEGLAMRIVNGEVPETMLNRKVLSLNMTSLLAGAKYKGEFEERIEGLIQQIVKQQDHIILFIDELHMIVGAGGSEGGMDTSNILKPYLARGELHCIGATTLDEYRQYIEKDPALVRRFQSIYIDEPSPEDTCSILRGIKEKYELFHGVRIADSAVTAAVHLSNRYITDRFLPDKAIDLMDQAAARMRVFCESKPKELELVEQEILQKQINVRALSQEKDPESQKQLEKLQKELQELENKKTTLTQAWETQKQAQNKEKNIKKDLENAKIELALCKRPPHMNLNRASELAHSLIPSLEKELQDLESANKAQDTVTDKEVAEIVSSWVNVPITELLSEQRDQLLHMESILHRNIIAQKKAVSVLSRAVRRSRSGLSDPHRPIGSFLFLGPTGVGKTETVKALASFLFHDSKAFLRFDMSEYTEKHAISRLIGSPPGYIGYEKGGMLTESVRRRPYQVILFDEIEKAHPDIFNILLQIMDEGRLTDSLGNVVNFKNTLVILTSNIGAETILDAEPHTDLMILINEQLKRYFKPEFINRLDEIVLFDQLTQEDIRAIVDIQIRSLSERMEKMHLVLQITEEAKDTLARIGYSRVYGARPLKRAIQNYIENPLSDCLLREQVDPQFKGVHIDVVDPSILSNNDDLSDQKVYFSMTPIKG